MGKIIYSITAHKRLYGGLIVALLAGAIGIYFMVAANAANEWFGADGNASLDNSVTYKHYNPGDHFNQKVSGNFTNFTNKVQSGIIVVGSNRSAVKYLGYTCTGKLPCKNVRFSGPLPPSSQYVTTAVCFNIPPSNKSSTGWLSIQDAFTVHYQMLRPWTHNLEYSTWPIAVWAAAAPGSCETNPTAKGLIYGGGEGGCGGSAWGPNKPQYPCDSGIDPGLAGPVNPGGDGKDTTGKDSTGRGKDGQGKDTGTGSGSSGGGSAANRQSDKPTPVSAAGDQGETDRQPELEPSPFFDGQTFAAGSDPDSLTGSIIKTGQAAARNWPWVVGGIAVAGGAGAAYWFWRRKE